MDVEASDVIQALARVLKPRLLAKERVAFQHHLLFGGPDDSTEGRQRQLASLFTETLKDAEFRWTPEALLALEKSSRGRGDEWRALADRLHDIRVCESVVAPSVALFIHLLGMDGKPVADAVARLRENWGSRLAVTPIDAVRQLEPKLAAGDADAGKRWVAVAESAATGDYQTLIELLVEVNRVVMAARGSTPWLEIRNGHFHVRFHEERGELPGRDDIATMWRYSYFLDSLRSVADQIGGAS